MGDNPYLDEIHSFLQQSFDLPMQLINDPVYTTTLSWIEGKTCID